MDTVININSLPEEILIEIFGYLTQNELGQLSSVCQRWNEYAKSPVLWRKVDVKFHWSDRSQYEIASNFAEKLSSSVTHMKLDFGVCAWRGRLNFEKLCARLKQRCFQLHTLIVNCAFFSVSLTALINLSSEFLPNLKIMILHKCLFSNYSREREYSCLSKIEVLSVTENTYFGRTNINPFSKMPNLKKLNLFGTYQTADWINDEGDSSFLHQLELLNVGCTDIHELNFPILLNHAVNLTQLFLCWAEIDDEDLRFNESSFLLLKTICLGHVDFLTGEGILSVVMSCQSLQDVYVDQHVAVSYANHPFVIANPSILGLVKAVDDCKEHNTPDFLFD